MTNSFSSLVNDTLKDAGVPLERFRAVTAHLMAHGVLMRDEDKTEQALYDDARRIEAMIFDYLAVMGMTVHHDINQQIFRLFPPGASAVGVTMVEEGGEGMKALKQRLSMDFVACVLALRSLYEERLHRGAIGTNGEAIVSMEDLSATLNGQLRRPLPSTQVAKAELIAELRRQRVIRTTPAFTVQDPDAFMAIRPYVLQLVSNETLKAALEDVSPPASQEESQAQA